MTDERDFAKQVVELAHLFGWLVGSHDKSARKVHGRWISNILGDRGEPDMRLVRPPRFIYAELKLGTRETRGLATPKQGGAIGGTYGLTPEQRQWKAALEACNGVEYFQWTPADLDRIAEILR